MITLKTENKVEIKKEGVYRHNWVFIIAFET